VLQLTAPRQGEDEEEESYFVSMTDMMVGLLFIFIIMLMYFALQLHNQKEALSDARDTRDEILNEIKREMGASVEISTQTGVVHIQGDTLFDKGSAELKPEGLANINRLAEVMALVLPCHVGIPGLTTPAGCQPGTHRIDAVFVEGHTDSDPMSGGQDNRDLSVHRALTTFRKVIAIRSELGTALNRPAAEGGQPLLSVSGYGPDRPIASNATEVGKAKNRRIDIRFIMATPEAPVVREIRRGLEQSR
jgi:chemotaxis protein MotB